jgi:hypothetical protein
VRPTFVNTDTLDQLLLEQFGCKVGLGRRLTEERLRRRIYGSSEASCLSGVSKTSQAPAESDGFGTSDS